MRLCFSMLALVSIALLQGCGGSDSTYNPALVRQNNPAPQGTFTLAVSPASTTVVPGAAATYTVTLQAGGGFDSDVQLAARNLPADTSAVFTPESLTPTVAGAVSVLTLQTTAATPDATPTPGATPTPTPDAGTGNLAGTIRSPHRVTASGASTITITATGGGITRTATVQLLVAAAD